LNEASKIVHDMVDKDANIIFGDVLDDDMAGDVRVTVIATGFDEVSDEPVEETTRVTDLRSYTPKPILVPAAAPDRATYLRKGKKVVGGAQLALEDLSEEVLDIPTFLRRQAD
jgi:cell division protein FtsZ